jgi:site-specific DNA-methyltransferase (adenine-specific)
MSIEILKGDCLEIMKGLPDKSVDCFICDLPYGQLAPGQGGKLDPEKYGKARASMANTGCAWDIKIDLTEFWKQVERLARNDAVPVIHFCNTKFGIDLINSKPDWFRYDLVYNKQRGVSFLLANKMPMKSHEMIYIFSKKGSYYNRIDDDDITKKKQSVNIEKQRTGNVYNLNNLTYSKGAPQGKRCSLSVLTFKNSSKNKHPTEKPIELYKWLIERYCPTNGTILDPTAGSCNSCFAGYELNRNCIAIEMNEVFYNNAIERLDAL